MIRFANRRMSQIQRIESQNQRHLAAANGVASSTGSVPPKKRRRGLGKWLLGASVVAIFAAIAPQTAFSQATFTWNNLGANWDSAVSWNPGGGPPGALDIAEFSIDAPGVVGWDNITGTRSVDRLRVTANDYTINNFGDSRYELKVGSNLDNAVEITGPTTVFTLRGLHLNVLNNGDVDISNGATLNLDGHNPNGTKLSADYLTVNGTVNLFSGAEAATNNSHIGTLPGNSNIVTVHGVGSKWTNTGGITVGAHENGELRIEAGGIVNNGIGYVGGIHSTTGSATVTGAGSAWLNSSELVVGSFGVGSLNIADKGRVTSLDGRVGFSVGSLGLVTVSGTGSQWTDSGNSLIIGAGGTGTLLVQAGGSVANVNGKIGSADGGSGSVIVEGLGSSWVNSRDLDVGAVFGQSSASLVIRDGGRVSNAFGTIKQGTVTVSGLGSRWTNGHTLRIAEANTATLRVEAGGEVISTRGEIGNAGVRSGSAIVTGAGSAWRNSDGLHIGFNGSGSLDITDGGLVTSDKGSLGSAFGAGVVTVAGIGSRWEIVRFITVGASGRGDLLVHYGGEVSNHDGYIGFSNFGVGNVIVEGAGSLWSNSGQLAIGEFLESTLTVRNGGRVNNLTGELRNGLVTVENAGSTWQTSTNLTVGGGSRTGTLNINIGGLVSVGGNTVINSTGAVNVNGGRFEFGTTNRTSFNRINATSGSLAGNLLLSGVTAASSLTGLSNSAVDTKEVNLVNSGRLHGNGELYARVTNTSSGEIRTLANQSLYFGGTNNSNAGEINNFGGLIEFEGNMTNATGGMIAGRGVFAANGGWSNNGVMAFSGGFADVLGDVQNGTNGVLVVAGGSTTTFYDDVEMSPGRLNISVSQNSNAVFLGSYNGGSTGLGTVHIMGDLRPGHSPAAVSFGGDLVLGNTAFTEIELGGLGAGDFDQLLVSGDLQLGGLLDVQLINGFSLGYNQTFDIGVVNGDLFGEFSNFSDGDLIGNFNGIDLFIDYRSGGMSGNGVYFFSAVPEPSSGLLVGLMALGFVSRRRSRSRT